MAITYSEFQCTPAYDEHKRLTGLVLWERQTWDGTETLFLFPSVLNFSQRIGGYLAGKAVRIKAATLILYTLTGARRIRGSIGTTTGVWNFLGPSMIGVQGDRLDLGLPDAKINFVWNDATPTNPFLAPDFDTAPAVNNVTALSVFLEVVE